MLKNPAAAPLQDADALSTMPLAEVPQGDVFASEAEKIALLRQEPYTRKGTMPERLVTRQQFIEDFLTRGFNERREERRGVNLVTRFTNPTNGKYYVLTRRFEREYADRRYAVLFPEARKGEQPKAGQPKPPAPAGEQPEVRPTPAKPAADAAPRPPATPVVQAPASPVAESPTPAEGAPSTEPAKAAKPIVPVELKPEERDFSYTPADDYTPRGAKTRIRANLDAIKLLKEIETAGRLASPEEKKVLARYTGWGAYKSVFDSEKAEAIEEFARQKTEMAKRYGAHSYYATMELPSHLENWKAEFGGFYDQLKKTLTDEEWRLAAQSVLNAHYTDEPICHRLWNIARHVGFEGGSVGEFGCGTGKVVAAMPADLRAKSTVLGVEKDSITARISKLLFPQARIEEGALQDVPIRPNSLDLVIGNVPFSDVYPSGQKGKVKFNLHNYFIARGLDALRPGGLAVLITSSSTLQNNDEQRNALADRAELLGAIRLPNDAFADNANTEVVTDILIVRKPTPERRVQSEVFRQVLMTEVAEGQGVARFDGAPLHKTTLVNEYFLRHPEMVLGLHSLRGKMYGAAARAGTDDDDGAGQYTVVSTPKMKPLNDRLDAAVAALPSRVPNSSQERAVRNPLLEDEEAVAETLTAATTDKVGGLVAVEGRLYQVSPDRELVSPDWHKADFKLPRGVANAAVGDELALSWMRVRDALRQVIKTDLNPHATDNDSDRCRATLRKAYGDFVEEHGRIGESKALRALLRYEPEFGNTEALEIVREVKGDGGKRQRQIEPAAILTTRTLRPAIAPAKAETVMDAVLISVGQHGRIDIPYICSLTGKDDEEGVKRLLAVEGVGYENPETGEMELRQHYLTGNVRRKLERAEEAAKADARFTLNVEALRAVQPARVPFDNIRAPLGSSWVPSELVRDFAAETFGQGSDFHLNYFQRGSTWLVSEFAWSNRLAQWSAKATERTVPPSEIFQAVLDQQPIRITYTVGTKDEKKIIFDEQGTANANERAEAMRQAWLKWIGSRQDARQMIEDAYNDTFNNVVAPDPDGRALNFPNIATGPGALVPRPHQRNGVMRVLSEQAGVIAYGVGFGKTLVGILGAYEMKRTGAAQKPMILCDNANYAQFVETARNVYPSARILHSTDDDMKAENRERFKNRVATGDWDLVLMQRSHFERVPVSQETEVKWLQAELADLRAVKSAADENAKGAKNRTASGFARRMAKALERAEERLKEKLERMKERSDEGLTWEQLGVDFLVVDESHREKKIGFATKFDVKGILRDGNTNPEVRVIYYGMEDTVTPAIWHRLQRKTAFIKQGLAAKGVGIEFEDTGEIRLEEMKAALITDKRQMRRAELIAEIKEQKVQREVVFNRGQSLRENLSAIESDIRVCERNLPKAQERAAAYAAHVAPPFSRPAECAAVVEVLNLRAPEQSTEKEREVIEKCTNMIQETKGILVGDSKAVTKQLDALVQAWKVLPLPQSQMKRELGTVTVNGLPLSIVKEQIRLITTDEDAICLVAYVGKPGQNGEWRPDADVKPARFGSGEALLKLTQATAEQAALEPAGLTQRLGVLRQEREEAAKLVDSVQPFDESRLTQLQADLVALEKDMREKPFQRGGDRFANRATAASQPAAAPLPTAAAKGGGRTGR
ncbi:hypothetical protein [Oleiharenicola sp. Vm1]|uniref:hypothetical protein n=1 Tax=Oleiharenicola sp. Vm1 TaxID=3398393 RepID=UPI0039F505F5